jgi:hypothetical protein
VSNKPTKWSEAGIANGLAAVALYSGSSTKAARALKEQGLKIPAATLHSWKGRHPEKYQRAQAEVNDRIWSEVGDDWRGIISDATKATAEAVDKARDAIARGDAKEATAFANAAKALSLAGAISTDKSGAVDGRITERKSVHDDRSLAEIFNALSQRFGATYSQGSRTTR